MAKFNTAAEARKAGAALFAAGKYTAWCENPCFGKFGVRIQISGVWFNLRTQERCVMEKLDQAWEEINALGGRDVQDNSYDQGIVDTVAKALDIIEALGGMDPKERNRKAA